MAAPRHLRPDFIAGALAAALIAAPAAAEDASAPRVIETRPLKLIGEGAAPPAPSSKPQIAITTPPLRLIGDGAAAPRGPEQPPPALTIETRPLKLIGAKP
jgi:hypothetical protein